MRSSSTVAPGRTITLNGAAYHVRDEGQGDQSVLLLHGMPDTGDVWRHQIDALLQAGYRVIAPDMLGYGATDKSQDVQRYRGERILGDMLALLDALALPQVDVVGHDDAAELYAADDGRFFRTFVIPSHPEADEVWSRMKTPEAMIGMLNWDRANPMASA